MCTEGGCIRDVPIRFERVFFFIGNLSEVKNKSDAVDDVSFAFVVDPLYYYDFYQNTKVSIFTDIFDSYESWNNIKSSRKIFNRTIVSSNVE